ncbi:hypothetical protein PAPHI01_1599 [Pancytospora philotis]|nr:hypothetical protein PAPHI01_1599 [Pancytospora philotis]
MRVARGQRLLGEVNQREAYKWLARTLGVEMGGALDGPVLDKATGMLATSGREKLSIARQHFAALAEKGEEPPEYRGSAPLRAEIGAIMGKPVEWAEVVCALKKCQNNKAVGVDGIPCEAYKVAIDDKSGTAPLSRAMVGIMSYCIETGFVPKEWEDNILVPIFKKGNTTDLDNYRGITLISTLSKVFLKILAARLAEAQAKHKIIRPEQIGFIEGEEGLSAVMTALEACERRRAHGLGTHLLFIDLQKAYDKVPQSTLVSKLKGAGLGERFVQLISNLYKCTQVRVRIGDGLSEPFGYERGVRQGCPLSPLIFDLFINDLLDGMKKVAVPGMWTGLSGICFADDTLILADSAADAQSKADALAKWMVANGMSVNVGKCGILSVNAQGLESITYMGGTIPCVENYVYLGVEINRELDYAKMARFRLKKAGDCLRRMDHVLRNPEVALEHKKRLIGGVLAPRAHYGIAVYAHSIGSLAGLAKLYNKAVARTTGKPNVCTKRALEELHLPTFPEIAYYHKVKSVMAWQRAGVGAGELIATAEAFRKTGGRGKPSTWCYRALTIMRRMDVRLTDPRRRVKEKIATHFSGVKRLNPDTRSQRLAARVGLKEGRDCRKLNLVGRESEGRRMQLRCRLGTVLTRNDLVRMNRTRDKRLGLCLGCGEHTEETVEHIVLECSLVEEARNNELRDIMEVVDARCPARKREVMLSWLLGGSKHTVIKGAGKRASEQRERFWQDVAMKRRTALIELMKAENSPPETV